MTTRATLSTTGAVRQGHDDGPEATPARRKPAVASAVMTVLVADAEPGARFHLCSLLGALPEVERVIECRDGAEAVQVIRARRPDLAFLEVELPGLGGFEVIRAVGPARMPPVVFVTGSEAYASRAFEVDALDYLLKPFDERRCLVALERARRRLELRAAAAVHQVLRNLAERREAGATLDRIAVKLRGRIVIVQVNDIDWLEARDNYVRLHVGRVQYLVRGTISALEARLDPRRFVRVHRGALVNVDRIVEVRSGLRGDTVVLAGGVQVPVGATRRAELLQRLGLSVEA